MLPSHIMFDEAVVVEVIFLENVFDLLLWSEGMTLRDMGISFEKQLGLEGRPLDTHQFACKVSMTIKIPCPKQHIGTSWLHGPLEEL